MGSDSGDTPRGDAPAPDPVETILRRCLQRPEEEWQEAIDEACCAHAEFADRIRRCFEQLGDIHTPESTDHPERIGPYRVLDGLGEGGMGTVYLAEQTAPVRRRVAVKLIKLGMDTRQVLRRFEAERQALALMEHDNIAKVFDAGVTARGQPYFVMELVAGKPLTVYCDEHRLCIEERIRLFQRVCAAVQHAHQKGIIHRDLKPSNVLVTERQDRPVPKIIDFGIAKATDHRLSPETMYTDRGQMVGTPEYMSPEQAGTSVVDVDTRADVYSLGVILYELVSGQLPFPRGELRGESPLEAQRRIREVEPPRPSTRVSILGEQAVELARRRGIEPRRFPGRLRLDLDWVVMKAIHKDRDRRYGTPEALSEDLQRHLDHEPVTAGPPGIGYRVRKFARRYRTQVLGAAGVVATLLAGMAGTTYFMFDAVTARAEETRAKEEAQANLEKFNLLSGVLQLRAAREAERTLRPILPESIPRAQAWLREHAEPLRRKLADIRSAIDALERRALPYMPADREADRQRHPARLELERRRRELIALQADSSESARRRRDEIGQEIATLQERIETERLTYRFADERDQFLHYALVELRADLERFTGAGAVARVAADVEWARRVKRLTIDAHADLWEETCAAIRVDDRYGRLGIGPQTGLIPLGRDPESGLFEFYHLRSAENETEVPARDARGRFRISGRHGIVFVLVPGGRFTMGAQTDDENGPNHDERAQANEFPPHRVTIEPFFLAKYELTQGQWLRLAGGENPCEHGAGETVGDHRVTLAHPVEMVTWRACHDTLERYGLALPTEAQWEYAYRAGSETPWPSGTEEDSLGSFANLADQSARARRPLWGAFVAWDDGYAVHAPVGALEPNEMGFHDMHGNVTEWCRDGYGTYDRQVRPGDGLRQTLDAPSRRVVRGASYRFPSGWARSAWRDYGTEHTRNHFLGMRASRRLQR